VVVGHGIDVDVQLTEHPPLVHIVLWLIVDPQKLRAFDQPVLRARTVQGTSLVHGRNVDLPLRCLISQVERRLNGLAHANELNAHSLDRTEARE
jgi:hypothetical protein